MDLIYTDEARLSLQWSLRLLAEVFNRGKNGAGNRDYDDGTQAKLFWISIDEPLQVLAVVLTLMYVDYLDGFLIMWEANI